MQKVEGKQFTTAMEKSLVAKRTPYQRNATPQSRQRFTKPDGSGQITLPIEPQFTNGEGADYWIKKGYSIVE